MIQVYLTEKNGGWEAKTTCVSCPKGYGRNWKEAVGDLVMLNAGSMKFQFIPLKSPKASVESADKEI